MEPECKCIMGDYMTKRMKEWKMTVDLIGAGTEIADDLLIRAEMEAGLEGRADAEQFANGWEDGVCKMGLSEKMRLIDAYFASEPGDKKRKDAHQRMNGAPSKMKNEGRMENCACCMLSFVLYLCFFCKDVNGLIAELRNDLSGLYSRG